MGNRFDELVMRYEEPNSMTRWDSPLFNILYDNPDLPMDEIMAVLENKDIRPNVATLSSAAREPEYLTELECITQEITKQVIEAQSNGLTEVAVANAENKILLSGEPISFPKLQRLRRQYVGINRVRPMDLNRIQSTFVDYLNSNFE